MQVANDSTVLAPVLYLDLFSAMAKKAFARKYKVQI